MRQHGSFLCLLTGDTNHAYGEHMKKILVITALALVGGLYFWPKETNKVVNTTVATATGTLTGALQGAASGLKK